MKKNKKMIEKAEIKEADDKNSEKENEKRIKRDEKENVER